LLGYAGLIAIAAYVLVLRPVRRQRALRDQVAAELAPGARVMLTSGLLATVVEVADGEVVLDVGGGVHLRYVVGAVRSVLDEPAPRNPSLDPGVSETDT
jgi:preprotein translocase subunit YajC